MITEIQMKRVASYKAPTSLKTDKKVNLIYGLNGTGKSTLSDFLYKPNDSTYADCKVIPEAQESILVYNQSFIHDNFYQPDRLKGIFSLSKENKAAEKKISDAHEEINRLLKHRQTKLDAKANAEHDRDQKISDAVDKIWEIKTMFSGGDRVLEYCLEGLKGKKETLFSHILSVAKPEVEPEKTITQLKSEVEALKDESAHTLPELPRLGFMQHAVESHSIFGEAIIGNDDSAVAALIEQLGNSDWVKQGLDHYLPEHIDEQGSPCPFCQARTITTTLVDNIAGYFDERYRAKITELDNLRKEYRAAIDRLPDISNFTSHPFAEEHKTKLEKLYNDCIRILENNIQEIEEKLKNPRSEKELLNSKPTFDAFNVEVDYINAKIKQHNTRLSNREASLQDLKRQFWELMRWRYDQTISRYWQDLERDNGGLAHLDNEIAGIDNQITVQNKKMSTAQKETVNIEEAIDSINAGLLDLGIDDFKIRKHTESLYRIVRSDQAEDAFQTLSEGEKMIISFLYFCERCKGSLSAEATVLPQRIAVIDDPISSLSHIYIFNVGQLIKRLFFNSDGFKQVFVLTHSLYFFYELTDPAHKPRKETQKLFRMIKNSTGSQIQNMKYEEIQNDYQSYWGVVKDPSQPPALIANCMRNIVEYFFNFVKKQDLNNVFQMPELQDSKYQAFCRYVNRESHSLGQNIFDLKEFDYNIFREGLRLVFETTGYSEHYKQMTKT